MVQNDHFLINLPQGESMQKGSKMIKKWKILKFFKNSQNELGASERYALGVLGLKLCKLVTKYQIVLDKKIWKIC